MTSGFPVGIEAAVSVELTIRFPTHPMNVDVGETVEVLTVGHLRVREVEERAGVLREFYRATAGGSESRQHP